MEDCISISLWHGGTIHVESSKHRYVGGESKLISVEFDKLSYFELVDYVMETGSYQSKDFIMYYLKIDDKTLKRLDNDQDVIDMGNSVSDKSTQIVNLYAQQHPISQPINFEVQPSSQPNTQPSSQVINPIGMKYSKLTARKSVPATPVSKQKSVALIDQEILDRESTDSDYDEETTDLDEETYDEEEPDGSDRDDDEWMQSLEAIKKVREEGALSKQVLFEQCLKSDEQEGGSLNLCLKDPVEAESLTVEGYSSYEESDGDVYTPGESEEDDIRGTKYKEHIPFINDQTDWKKFNWVVGIRFPSRDAFRSAVRRFAVANGRNLWIARSDRKRQDRIVVKCVKGCPFTLRCSFHKGKECYMVKTVKNSHTCQRNMSKNRQLSADFIANEFLSLFKAKPNWPAKEIQLAVKEKHKVLINKWLAYKAKASAHKKLHGSMKDHYSKIGSYLAALRHANPNSTFNLVTAPPADPSSCDTFFRLFICFEGVKKGFLAGCRKVLCLDGCFLKTFLGGMLLAAVGRDANDQMFPLAWAVVEGENNDSWEWFMCQLQTCLGITDGGKGWTLISDQQKGLLNAVSLVWRNAEHRNCARHIYANWHKTYKGEDLKGVFWKAVRAYCEADFNEAIKEMNDMSSDAVEAFMKQNPKCFARCFLDTHTKCDVIVNNMAETFNGYIVQARSKHIINMLEDIRVAIMTRLTQKHTQMLQKDVFVCPRIQFKVDKAKERAIQCEAFPSSVDIYQVTDHVDSVCVDLINKTCTCRKWQLRGTPCRHVCTVAGFLGKSAEEYVDPYYYKESYLKSYQFTIPPMASERYWPCITSPLDPPPIKVAPGRPKKNRRRDAYEDPKKPGKLTKHGVQMTCSVCKSKGHNKRKCPSTGQSSSATVVKRGRGRPKKSIGQSSSTQ